MKYNLTVLAAILIAVGFSVLVSNHGFLELMGEIFDEFLAQFK